MIVRLRLFFLSMDTQMDIPLLKQRLLNTLNGFVTHKGVAESQGREFREMEHAMLPALANV